MWSVRNRGSVRSCSGFFLIWSVTSWVFFLRSGRWLITRRDLLKSSCSHPGLFRSVCFGSSLQSTNCGETNFWWGSMMNDWPESVPNEHSSKRVAPSTVLSLYTFIIVQRHNLTLSNQSLLLEVSVRNDLTCSKCPVQKLISWGQQLVSNKNWWPHYVKHKLFFRGSLTVQWTKHLSLPGMESYDADKNKFDLFPFLPSEKADCEHCQTHSLKLRAQNKRGRVFLQQVVWKAKPIAEMPSALACIYTFRDMSHQSRCLS